MKEAKKNHITVFFFCMNSHISIEIQQEAYPLELFIYLSILSKNNCYWTRFLQCFELIISWSDVEMKQMLTWKMILVSIKNNKACGYKLLVEKTTATTKSPFLALLISSRRTIFRTLLLVSPSFSSKLLWILLPFSVGFWTFSFPPQKKEENQPTNQTKLQKRSSVVLYCWTGKRGTARLKGSNQWLAI